MPFRKPDVHVLLYENVVGLGGKGEIVQTSLGLARNYLIPFKMAYYAPKLRGKPVLPPNWQRKDDLAKDAIQTVYPAFFSPAALSQASIANPLPQSKKAAAKLEGVSAMTGLGTLEFRRPLIDPKGRRTFGSVSPDDVVTLLREKHGILLDRTDVLMEGGRIKETGEHQITVKLANASQTVQINIIGE
ncbi:hypothetical protein BC830DRAFT_1095774 [Chytriomyces sp. MP71]|nr:hypothetical protein BC830DRAFT_1095774 [Chytriomyces sp. MP71]